MDVLVGRVARELARLEEQMDRAFERAFGEGLQLPRSGDSFAAAVDVYETEDAVIVQAELAGVRSEDIKLTVDGEYLQISGRRAALHSSAPLRHLQMEIAQGRFERVIRIPVRYDAERVSASLDSGILSVTLPRAPGAVRRVEVK